MKLRLLHASFMAAALLCVIADAAGETNRFGCSYPYDAGALLFPADEGAHAFSADAGTVEAWSLYGIVYDPLNHPFGLQITVYNFDVPLVPSLPELTNLPEMVDISVLDVLTGERIVHSTGPALEETEFRRDMLNLRWESGEIITTGEFRYRCQVNLAECGVAATLECAARRWPLPAAWDGYAMLTRGVPGYVYSLTDLPARGTLTLPGRGEFAVSGGLQLDHLWFAVTNDTLADWADNNLFHDWISVRLDNGTDLLFWRCAPPQGTPYVVGVSVLRPDGSWDYMEAAMLPPEQAPRLEMKTTWYSAITGNTYPADWELELPSLGLLLNLTPILPDAEIPGVEANTDYSIWSGPLAVYGTMAGAAVMGAGWSRSMARETVSLGPNPPRRVTVTPDDKAFQLSWTGPGGSNVVGYLVSWGRGLGPGDYDATVETGLVTAYEVAGLRNGQTYRVAVQTVDTFGRRSPRTTVNLVTPRGEEPVAGVRLSQSVYRGGDVLQLTLRIANGGPAVPVLAYVAVETDSGPLFYPSWTTAPEPLPRWAFSGDQTEVILRLPLPPDLPSGTVRFMAALTYRDGALISSVAETSCEFVQID